MKLFLLSFLILTDLAIASPISCRSILSDNIETLLQQSIEIEERVNRAASNNYDTDFSQLLHKVELLHDAVLEGDALLATALLRQVDTELSNSIQEHPVTQEHRPVVSQTYNVHQLMDDLTVVNAETRYFFESIEGTKYSVVFNDAVVDSLFLNPTMEPVAINILRAILKSQFGPSSAVPSGSGVHKIKGVPSKNIYEIRLVNRYHSAGQKRAFGYLKDGNTLVLVLITDQNHSGANVIRAAKKVETIMHNRESI